MPISDLGRRLGARGGRYWTKTGPDAISLQESHRLQILSDAGQLRHIRILAETGEVYVEMSGQVVLNPDDSLARNHPVEVKDAQMKSFGTFSVSGVFWTGCLQALAFTIRYILFIQVEQGNTLQTRWGRVGVSVLTHLASSIAATDLFSIAVAGAPASALVQLLAVPALTSASTPLLLMGASETVAVGASALFTLFVPVFFHYWRTRHAFPDRKLRRSFLWMLGLSTCAHGLLLVLLLICTAYVLLIQDGYYVAGSFFLPCVAAASEALCVAASREAYCRFAWPHRTGGTGAVPGDQLNIPVTFSLALIHGGVECMRLTAVLAGVIRNDGLEWIVVAVATYTMNILVRLGWIRFALFSAVQATCGNRVALRLFGVTAWTKLHDEIKIYLGYFRFIPVLALVVARAIVHGLQPFDHPQTPGFSLSAFCAILVFLLTEILEDATVVKQLLPESPTTVAMQEGPPSFMHPSRKEVTRQAGEFSHLGLDARPKVCRAWASLHLVSFPSLNFRQGLEEPKLWEPGDLCGALRIVRGTSSDAWGKLRRNLGEASRLVPSPSLHGLRELPFILQFSLAGALCNMMTILLAAFLGDGYLRKAMPLAWCFAIMVGVPVQGLRPAIDKAWTTASEATREQDKEGTEGDSCCCQAALRESRFQMDGGSCEILKHEHPSRPHWFWPDEKRCCWPQNKLFCVMPNLLDLLGGFGSHGGVVSEEKWCPTRTSPTGTVRVPDMQAARTKLESERRMTKSVIFIAAKLAWGLGGSGFENSHTGDVKDIIDQARDAQSAVNAVVGATAPPDGVLSGPGGECPGGVSWDYKGSKTGLSARLQVAWEAFGLWDGDLHDDWLVLGRVDEKCHWEIYDPEDAPRPHCSNFLKLKVKGRTANICYKLPENDTPKVVGIHDPQFDEYNPDVGVRQVEWYWDHIVGRELKRKRGCYTLMGSSLHEVSPCPDNVLKELGAWCNGVHCVAGREKKKVPCPSDLRCP
ncbi:unnamed protein product [Symbiodinium sp. CCMP2592]|nr:unnamed protein product [Symbiodinium sp. CCMP2592]